MKSTTRRRFVVPLIVLAVLSGPDIASASSVGAQRPGLAEAFRDLPGVRPPSDLFPKDDEPVCEQVVVERDFPFEPTRAPQFSVRYRCTKDGVTFESDRMPRNLERIKRGLDW